MKQSMSCRNAAQVLPKPLLREVQRYAAGVSLWVPVVTPRAQQHRMQVLALRAQGLKIREIATEVEISQRQVKSILHRDRHEAQQGRTLK